MRSSSSSVYLQYMLIHRFSEQYAYQVFRRTVDIVGVLEVNPRITSREICGGGGGGGPRHIVMWHIIILLSRENETSFMRTTM